MKNINKNKRITNIIIIIFIAIFISAGIYNIYIHCLFPRKYEDIVNEAGKLYNVDPYLIFAIIKQESKFNNKAVSKSNAKGLMQILDKTAIETVKNISSISNNNYDIFDIYTNINIGSKYFSNLVLKYEGNIYISLAAYNAGMGNISSWFDLKNKSYDTLEDVLEDVKFAETKLYIINVIKYYNTYMKLYN